MRLNWREQDISNYLLFFIISYLHYSLQIADNKGLLITCKNCYNFNVFELGYKNSSILSINTEIFARSNNI